MELNDETVNAHFELMTKPREYDLPIRPLEECFEPSETATAQHILFKDYQRENPNCAKVFFYIVMEMVYGRADVKAADGSLGFNLRFVAKNVAEDESRDWEAAHKHFVETRSWYQSLAGTPGVNTSIALEHVFRPLAERYERGERSPELFKAMMNVE